MTMPSNPTIASLLERRTCRAFKDTQLPDDIITAIVETGRYAATARGIQPQHFTVVQSKTLLTRLVAAARQNLAKLNDENSRRNAENPDYNTFYAAPTVILLSAAPEAKYGEADCANSAQNMAVAAHSLNVGSCYIASVRMAFAGPDGPTLLKDLGVPNGHAVRFALALGYAASAPAPAAPRKDNVNWIR